MHTRIGSRRARGGRRPAARARESPSVPCPSEFSVEGSRFRVQGGCLFQCLVHLLEASEFRVQGSGFRVQGAGFRVQGEGFKV
jgi:hypothetical protein